MDSIRERFPFLVEHGSTGDMVYARGVISRMNVMVSKKKNQWILTINNIYFVVAYESIVPPPTAPAEIVAALMDISEGKPIIPNALAVLLRHLTLI